jgi:hypothetical protein
MMWFGGMMIVIALLDGFARWSSGARYRKVKAILEQQRASRSEINQRMERAVQGLSHYYEPSALHVLALIAGTIIFIAGVQGH